MSIRFKLCAGLIFLLATLPPWAGSNRTQAEDFSWLVPVDGDWQTPNLWWPFLPGPPAPVIGPPGFGDTATISFANRVLLQGNVLGLQELTLQNGARVVTNGHQMSVVHTGGETHIQGAGSELVARPTGGTNVAFFTNDLFLTDGGELDIEGTTAEVEHSMDIDGASIVTGRGTLRLDNTATLNNRGTIRPDINQTLTIEGDSALDLDGSGVDNQSYLDLTNRNADLVVAAELTDAYSGRIDIGEQSRLHMDEDWTLGGTGDFLARLRFMPGSGNTATLDGADLSVGGVSYDHGRIRAISGTGRIEADTTLYSNADVNISADATLDFDGDVRFLGGSYTGSGTLDVGVNNRVDNNTTIDMPTGIVDLDAGDWVIGEDLVINAERTDTTPTITAGGQVFNNHFDNRTIRIDANDIGPQGMLEVNLIDPQLRTAQSWVLGSSATMDINGVGGNFGTPTMLAGSPLLVFGRMDVSGRARSTAPLHVHGGFDANGDDNDDGIEIVGANSRLTIAADSSIAGGRIHGTGTLHSTGANVTGYGEIQADLNFSGGSQIWADNGTLRLSGDADALGEVIGTADDDATLQLAFPFAVSWDTSLVDRIELNGGELTGTSLRLESPLVGHGLVSSVVTNNNEIRATGGQLVFTGNMRPDGNLPKGEGVITANDGDILLGGNLVGVGTSYLGTINVGDGREFVVDSGASDDGFRLAYGTDGFDGTLNLTGGTFESDHLTQAGFLTVDDAPSTLRVGQLRFENGGQSTVNDDLHLAGHTTVENGHTFGGTGRLVNNAGSILRTENLAEADVIVVNEGDLAIGDTLGRFDVADYQQEATGSLFMEIGGGNLGEFDRLLASGNALLDGSLNVSLTGGFLPELDDMFTILSAPGGVNGMFAVEHVPLFGGLTFDVLYNPTNVTLQVVTGLLPGDMNGDGLINFADLQPFALMLTDPDAYAEMFPELDGVGLCDINGDMFCNFADLSPFTGLFGGVGSAAGSASASAAVPEPNTTVLVVGLILLIGVGHRRRDV